MAKESTDTNLILINGNLVTLDSHRPRATWVVTQNNKIICAGSGDDWKNFRPAKSEIIDCKGKTVLPGFIDAHLHLHSFAESLVTLDLRPGNKIRSISDLQLSIRTFSQDLQPGTWIRGKGYDEFYLSEKRHPNRWEVDAATTDHPVKITHRSGHAHVLNSLALKLVNITKETGDPPEGMIDRDLETGEPTGLLYEVGDFLSERIPSIDPKELEKGVQLANHELVSRGITSIQDVSSQNDAERWRLFRLWKKFSTLDPRLSITFGFPAFKECDLKDFSSHLDASQLRVNGVKIILDETTGRLYPSQEELDQMVFEIHEAGLQATIHAIEEKAIQAAYNSIKYALQRIPKKDHRHRIEHCSVCLPDLARQIAALHVMVVTQPPFIYYNGDRYLKTVPEKKLNNLYALRTLIKSGVIVAGGSDCPIVPPDPLIGVYAAVSRMSETGNEVLPKERISALDAIKLYTINAARASFEERIKGSISPDKLADLVVLSGDPTNSSPPLLNNLEVQMTILNGKIVWDKSV